MKRLLVILLLTNLLLSTTTFVHFNEKNQLEIFTDVVSFRGLLSSSCRKRAEVCRGDGDCCPVMGRRMVCAPHLGLCGKKVCCITEVEEQEEKQAAIIRNRQPKSIRMWEDLLDEDLD